MNVTLQLAAWIAVCGVFAFLTRNRPAIFLTAAVALWFLVPAVGSPLITGKDSGPLSFHAATWLIGAVVLVQACHRPHRLSGVARRHPYVSLALVLVLGAAALTTFTGEGGGTVQFIDQMVAPIALAALVIGNAQAEPAVVPVLKNALIVLTAIASVVAIAQWVTGKPIVYESGFQTQYWYHPEAGGRWMGTLDQPLALSMAATAVSPLLAGLRRAMIQVPLLLLFAAAVLVSQSRTGMVLFAVVVGYLLLFSRLQPAIKVFTVGVIGACAVAVLGSPLADGISRFKYDAGSTVGRQAASDFFFAHWPDYFLLGDGVSSSYRVTEHAGLDSSLENPFMMYSVDIGVVFAVLYFGALAYLVVRYLRGSSVPGLGLAAVMAILIPQTYSSLATRSVAAILMWVLIALLVAARAERGKAAAVPADSPALAARPWLRDAYGVEPKLQPDREPPVGARP